MRRRPTLALCLSSAALAIACGSSTPPPAPSPSPGGNETITGRERLGWDQRADNPGELATFRYAIYVDGARSEMAGVNCGGSAGPSGYACSGALPAMGAGAHTLELAAYRQDQPGVESPRSSALRVTVTGASPGDGAGSWSSGDAGTTADGLALRVEHLASGLDRPTDAAFDPYGRLFIAERAGRVRIFADERLVAAPALAIRNVTGDGGLLAIALDPQFTTTRHVYTLSSAASRAGPVFRLARYRELRGVMAQRAILFETPAPPMPAGAMRFGPDGKLYLTLGPAAVDDPASYVGKVLRLNTDGTAPRDRDGVMPVFAGGFIAPRALAWRPGAAMLWIADGSADGLEWITGIAAVEGSPPPASWGMPRAEVSSALAFYAHERIPEFRDQLFVASGAAPRLLRVRFDPGDPLTVIGTERLLEDRVGPIRVVLPGPDGALYFSTEWDLGRVSVGDGR